MRRLAAVEHSALTLTSVAQIDLMCVTARIAKTDGTAVWGRAPTLLGWLSARRLRSRRSAIFEARLFVIWK